MTFQFSAEIGSGTNAQGKLSHSEKHTFGHWSHIGKCPLGKIVFSNRQLAFWQMSDTPGTKPLHGNLSS